MKTFALLSAATALLANVALADFALYTEVDNDPDCGVAKTGGCHINLSFGPPEAGPVDIGNKCPDDGKFFGASKNGDDLRWDNGICGGPAGYTCSKKDGKYSCKDDAGGNVINCDSNDDSPQPFFCTGFPTGGQKTYKKFATCKGSINC